MSEDNARWRSAVYQALCACLGLTPGSAAADTLLQPAWSEPEPTPQAPRQRNVIYYALARDDSAEPLRKTLVCTGREGSEKPAAVQGLLAYSLRVICYGPEAEDNAERIRCMLVPDGAGSPRAILRKAGVYPIPDPPQPQVLAETESGLYRRRADLAVSLRVRQELKTKQPGIASVPNIIVHGR